MKIAIIGGGWVGCHLASKLLIDHEVSLYEKNTRLFTETSYNNQNRLHLGYHYPRSSKTRDLCKNTFDRFIDDYNFLTKQLSNNWYAVVSNKSIIDFGTFSQIFNTYKHNTISKCGLTNIEGCINVLERQIDFQGAHEYFNNKLSNIHIKKQITKKDLDKLAKRYDFVIDCTNNCLFNLKEDCYYELTVSFLYKKIKETEFDALTLVDGNFFSIYPYKDNLYTLTDVENTPLKRFNNIKKLETYKKDIDGSDNFFKHISKKIEKKVKKYFADFENYYEYYGYFLSVKSKIKSGSDNRAPIIISDKNIIQCFTGKIQGIYLIEDFVIKYIENYYDNRAA